jgi:hypothetical protein
MILGQIVEFPPSSSLRPEQVIGNCSRTQWSQFIGLGITEAGEFEIVNSDMTAERALWLIEWAKRWALGLDEVEEAR